MLPPCVVHVCSRPVAAEAIGKTMNICRRHCMQPTTGLRLCSGLQMQLEAQQKACCASRLNIDECICACAPGHGHACECLPLLPGSLFTGGQPTEDMLPPSQMGLSHPEASAGGASSPASQGLFNFYSSAVPGSSGESATWPVKLVRRQKIQEAACVFHPALLLYSFC